MAYFRYKLIESTGQINSGILRLPYDTEPTVISFLERDGNTVLFVKKLNLLFSGILGVASAGQRRKVARKQTAEFLSNLSVMLRSGLPMISSLRELTADGENPGLTAAAQGMVFYVESGSSLSEAAGHYPHVFSNTVLYLIRIGEETGSLEQTLLDAAEHLKRIDRILSDTKQAMLYPSFVLVSMSIATLFWFYYVVPKIVGLFKEMGVDLPWITLALLTVSELFQAYIVHIIAILAVLVVGVTAGVKHNRRCKKLFQAVLMKIPIVKDILHASNLAFISEYLRLLLNAGVDAFRSLQILAESIGNEIYRERVHRVRDGLTNGQSVSESFRAADIFPSFIVRMVGVGEQSGTLPDQLNYIAEEYQRRLAVIVATIGKLIEPLVLIIAGLLFGVIVAGLFLPIYDLIGNIA